MWKTTLSYTQYTKVHKRKPLSRTLSLSSCFPLPLDPTPSSSAPTLPISTTHALSIFPFNEITKVSLVNRLNTKIMLYNNYNYKKKLLHIAICVCGHCKQRCQRISLRLILIELKFAFYYIFIAYYILTK